MPPAHHWTLASWLSSRSDDELRALLRARPDLASPIPRDFTQLASRAGSRPSVLTAIDHLDRLSLNVLAAFAVPAQPVALKEVTSLLGDDPHVLAAVQRVREMALVFGEDDGMRLTNAVANLINRPAGLGEPYLALLRQLPHQRLKELAEEVGVSATGAAAEIAERIAPPLADGQRINELLADPPPGVLNVLTAIDTAGGVGTIDDALRPVSRDDADTPVRWLLAHRLLIAKDDVHVELPREVGLALRGGHLYPSLETEPPSLVIATLGVTHIEGAAAGQAHTFVHLTERLLGEWGTEPPSVLRSGGLGVRELRRAARMLDVEESIAAAVVETAHAAGLIAKSGYIDGDWLPTEAFDHWRTQPTEKRWIALANAWLDMKRLVALSTPAAVDAEMREKAANVLSPDAACHWASRERHEVLSTIARNLPAESVTDVDGLLRHLVWCRPSRGMPPLTLAAKSTFEEAGHLGLLGRGGVPSWTRALLGLAEGDAAELLAPHLPQPLDYVLLQADLTAIAPGPLEPTLAAELSLAADVESTGGATVYRFTETSLRRALDAGRSAADLHGLVEGHSRTPVPQPLSYLIDDVARRHGRLRIGTASAYLRCDDPAVLNELLADRRSAGLRLQTLAPNVVVSQAPPDLLLTRLREMGYAPALESPEGAVMVLRPEERRAPTPTKIAMPSWVDQAPETTSDMLTAAIRAVRVGEQAARHAAEVTATEQERPPLLLGSAGDTLTALREAVLERRSVWIGYVNAHGQESHRIIEPLEIDGGYVAAYDHRTDEVRTFAIHRITGLAEVPRS